MAVPLRARLQPFLFPPSRPTSAPALHPPGQAPSLPHHRNLQPHLCHLLPPRPPPQICPPSGPLSLSCCASTRRFHRTPRRLRLDLQQCCTRPAPRQEQARHRRRQLGQRWRRWWRWQQQRWRRRSCAAGTGCACSGAREGARGERAGGCRGCRCRAGTPSPPSRRGNGAATIPRSGRCDCTGGSKPRHGTAAVPLAAAAWHVCLAACACGAGCNDCSGDASVCPVSSSSSSSFGLFSSFHPFSLISTPPFFLG
mmetsp:Transcript_8769/g.27979  ORF Transcript_8769/g.27979 Transcript_8769/m.27979 type:complete len:254 (+) Transcript_8769:393-1154(+)